MRMDERMVELTEYIRVALENAAENGYADELAAMVPLDLAIDLRDRDEDVGRYELEEIVDTIVTMRERSL